MNGLQISLPLWHPEGMSILLNPKQGVRPQADRESKELLLKTIQFFEKKGNESLRRDDYEYVWYADFIEFAAREKLFATFLTPSEQAIEGASNATRWDTYRNCDLNEILGFYGLAYWYTWQVSILGLGPLWMSGNAAVKKKTAQFLDKGGIFAFGLSEKEHGADLYSSEMTLTQNGADYLANGRKYYIGNANEAAIVSTFGKMKDTGNPDDYVFFAVNPKHEKYNLVQNVVRSQSYVAEYALSDYPITESDILSRGQAAWDSALNTVNIGKYNLGWGSIGIATHALYETINHASHRRLFDHYVTDFPHIRMLLTDSYSRLIAMKLFATRASDYMRSASSTDRRYLLFNPMVKMKVTTQGEEVVALLADIIAAKGFEKNMYFENATRNIRALPKLEGTVHVNMALIIKFMKNYFFKPGKFPTIPTRADGANDSFLFNQGATKGLGRIQFHDYRIAYDSLELPNIRIFKRQIRIFKALLAVAKPNSEQTKDFDFLLILGELFTLVVYGQLIIEEAVLKKISNDEIDQIFDFIIRDFSKFALQLYSKTSSTRVQRAIAMQMIAKPSVNTERTKRIWNEKIATLKDCYSSS